MAAASPQEARCRTACRCAGRTDSGTTSPAPAPRSSLCAKSNFSSKTEIKFSINIYQSKYMCMSDKFSQQHNWIWICFTKKTVTNDLIIGAERVNDKTQCRMEKEHF